MATNAPASGEIIDPKIPTAFDVEAAIKLAATEIEKGNFRAAKNLLTEAILRQPDSLDLLNSASLVCLQCGDYRRAEHYLLKALRLVPTDKNLLHNLALTYWAQENFSAARTTFQRILESHPDDAETLNDLALLQSQAGEIDEAGKIFRSAISQKNTSQKTFTNYFEFCLKQNRGSDLLDALHGYEAKWGADATIVKWRQALREGTQPVTAKAETAKIIVRQGVQGLKIAFFASFHSFLEPIMNDLKGNNQIRLFERGNEREMQEALNWCDLAWFEWCDSLLIAATKLPKRCKIICRLHSYEAFTEMPRQVDWNKVDHLVLVNQSVAEILSRSVRIPTPATIIHNGVDTDKFTIPAGKTYGKRICSIGYINYKKNPALLLYCFKAIHDYDNDYRFHIAGEHQDPRIQIYFEHLLPKLNIPLAFDGWVNDIPAYLRDKDYVISTSLFESFHYSIAEGMASGVMPLIHDWLGADYLYPPEFLFTTPAECVELVREIERRDRQQLGQQCRDYIKSHYDLKSQLVKIQDLIKSVMENRK